MINLATDESSFFFPGKEYKTTDLINEQYVSKYNWNFKVEIKINNLLEGSII